VSQIIISGILDLLLIASIGFFGDEGSAPSTAMKAMTSSGAARARMR
jgi:hypothetical protein